MNIIKSLACMAGFFLVTPAQANVHSYFNKIKTNPNALYAFLKDMPKGGELHYHLAGGPYPETMLGLASGNDYCLDTKTLALAPYTQDCTGINTKELFKHPELYAQTLRSWSMKDFVPGIESGHDHFFNSFMKFIILLADFSPELVADVMKNAASQQEQYLELMILPDNGNSMRFGSLLHDKKSFAEKRALLLANPEFRQNIEHTATESDRILTQARHHLGCDSSSPAPACTVTIKFLYYSLREQPEDSLFAQTLNAFEAVTKSQKTNGSLVGVNLVQPEDGIISLRDYQKHMRMYQYLHQIYPQVPIALHAGELTQELVPPKDLQTHIRDALFIGQAQRIGHGVAIGYENEPEKTLNYMATLHKPVEINLISNHKILNVYGRNHPLNYYLSHQVPVVLSTDDEGILRTNLTAQYVEAVMGHGVDYPALKQITRNVLTYSFAPGKSLWQDAAQNKLIPECSDLQSPSCKVFIQKNEKARLQWALENKLTAFENRY